MTSVDQAFERIPFVRALGPHERERLLPYARVKAIGIDEGCWTEGQSSDDFAFVIQGRVKLVKTSESGREAILEMTNPGELLCGSTVICYAPHCCSSLAMERGTEVLLLPRRDVLELVERSPTAARALMRELTDRGINMCRRVEELTGGQVEQRIALLLLKLATKSGVVRAADGIHVPIRLTRQDLADLCATTVETAIRVMSRLEKQDVVRTTADGFLVRDRAALEEISRAPARCR
jgi:CRP/FNR family transcriptional regulator